jgi:hypothetical protein
MAGETVESSFDELARGLASGNLSRGKALRLVGGALLGAALASVPGVALADDDCRSFGRRCRRDSQCCSRNCVRRGDEKVCGCPEGKTRCGGRCVAKCTGGQTLDPETCECGCPSGQVPCNGNCVSGSCPGGQTLNTTTCQCECPSGRVLLSNGTCATPCSTVPECPNCVCIGASVNPDFLTSFCGTIDFGGSCETDANCPTGQFCARIGEGTSCLPAC